MNNRQYNDPKKKKTKWQTVIYKTLHRKLTKDWAAPKNRNKRKTYILSLCSIANAW
jgi:hypothetical protein